LKTTLADIYDIRGLKRKLKIIKDYYIPLRAKQRGIKDYTYIQDYDITDYLEDCRLMSQLIVTVGNYNILKSFKNVVFEGAQGLLLDEFHYYYPHVTRSRTGIINATDILKSIGEKKANVHYVTRTYTTRHGQGPLSNEGNIDAKDDLTNTHNEHQGALRFAPLNLRLMQESITNDLVNHNGLNLTPSLKVTWGQFKDDLIAKRGYVYGEKLAQELHKMLPNTNQTWFYSPLNESMEIV